MREVVAHREIGLRYKSSWSEDQKHGRWSVRIIQLRREDDEKPGEGYLAGRGREGAREACRGNPVGERSQLGDGKKQRGTSTATCCDTRRNLFSAAATASNEASLSGPR